MNKNMIRSFMCAAALLVVSAGAADAVSTLNITGFRLGGASIANVSVVGYGSGWSNRSFQVGGFSANLDNVAIFNPIYCLDIFHSFGFGQTWQVEPILIPPDPDSPPPYNTDEAAWIYNKYGKDAATTTASAAVQIALWEVSHQEEWRAEYDELDWFEIGDFQLNTLGSIRSGATAILNDVYDNFAGIPDASATYYQPYPYDDNTYSKQGQIGDRYPTPEPGSLIMLALGVLSFAGVSARRRRRA